MPPPNPLLLPLPLALAPWLETVDAADLPHLHDPEVLSYGPLDEVPRGGRSERRGARARSAMGPAAARVGKLRRKATASVSRPPCQTWPLQRTMAQDLLASGR